MEKTLVEMVKEARHLPVPDGPIVSPTESRRKRESVERKGAKLGFMELADLDHLSLQKDADKTERSF